MNGKKYGKNFFTHEDLMKGADISFLMTDKPNFTRGTQIDAFPYSFSNEHKGKK